jgi:GGDEF domain-containing protein
MTNWRPNRVKLGADFVSLNVTSISRASHAVYLASILAMVSIFGLDLANGSTVSLQVLYVFPILCRSLSRAIITSMTMAGLSITASTGFAAFEQAPDSVSMPLQKADRAMYAVKAGRSRSRAAVAQRAQQQAGDGLR